jgi:phasin family protein
MNQIVEDFVALNKKQAETAIQAFRIGMNAWEMLIKLNLEATKSLLQEGISNLKALPHAGAGPDFSALTAQIQAGSEKMSGYSRNVYEIGGRAASEWGELLEQTLLNTNQEVLEWVDEAVKSSSIPQPEATAAAAKAAMANSKTIIEGISKAVRQTAGFADANVRAAVAATTQAVKSNAK